MICSGAVVARAERLVSRTLCMHAAALHTLRMCCFVHTCVQVHFLPLTLFMCRVRCTHCMSCMHMMHLTCCIVHTACISFFCMRAGGFSAAHVRSVPRQRLLHPHSAVHKQAVPSDQALHACASTTRQHIQPRAVRHAQRQVMVESMRMSIV